MKIAMMTNNYKPFVGGVPISVDRLAEGLRLRGHEVCIFAPDYGTEEEETDVVRIRTRRKRLENHMVVPALWDRRIGEEFEARGFDLIHVHQPMLMGNLALHLSRHYRIPLVYTYHTRYEAYLHHLPFLAENPALLAAAGRALPAYMNYFMSHCSAVFAPSEEIRSYLDRQGTAAPVEVLPTGLDAASYEEDAGISGGIREKYGQGRPYLICTVSRLEKEKNLYFLLRTVRELKRHLGTDFRLLLIGDGGERARLEAYAEELGIGDVTAFAGEVPNEEIRHYLFASDLFLFASRSETQGIVLAEAMAAGLPVAAVRASGTSDIVADGRNGCLTEEREEELAAEAAEILLHGELRRRMSDAARQTAQRYRAERIALQAQQVYQNILEERGERHAHLMPRVLQLFKTS